MNGKELKKIVEKANDDTEITFKCEGNTVVLYGVMDDFLGTKLELEFKHRSES